MKKRKSVALWFTGIAVFFSFCYYVSYQSTLKQIEEQAQEQDFSLRKILSNQDLIPYAELPTDDSITVSEPERIRPGTICVNETIYIDTGEQKIEELPPNADFIGLSREEVIDYLSRYMNELSFQEYEQGLISYELLSFSKARVVVRKTYDRTLVQNRFYLTVSDQRIVVYYSDKKTVYDYTDIYIDELSDKYRNLVLDGMFVKDQESLYDLLAGFTS